MAKMVLKTFDEINASRKRTRIISTLILIPFLLVVGFLGYKISEMYITSQIAIDKFASSEAEETSDEQRETDLAEADKLTAGLENGFFVDRWIALYNRGTVLTANTEYAQAIEKFQLAINEISSEDPNVCLIYANLAIANERYGDEFAANDATTDAEYWYDQALLVVENAPAICSPPPNNGEGDSEEPTEAEESLENTEERVEGKQQELGESDGTGETDPNAEEQSDEGEQTTPEKSDVEEIREQMDQSEQERMEDTSNSDGAAQEYSKPW